MSLANAEIVFCMPCAVMVLRRDKIKAKVAKVLPVLPRTKVKRNFSWNLLEMPFQKLLACDHRLLCLLPSGTLKWSTISQMTSRGGVCVCPQKELPNVLASVGYTGHAAAVVLVQSPDELGLRAYPRDFIICTLLVPSLNGEIASVRAKRWLVQLGFGPRVEMIAEGTEISMPIHMLKMVCKLGPLRGWISGFHPAAIFMEQIVAHVPEAAVESVICRENGTCTFLCHESVSSKLLKASGCNGAFYKVHRDDPSFVELDLFWLPESMSFDESLQLAKHDSARGLVEKGSSGRLAIRFESATGVF